MTPKATVKGLLEFLRVRMRILIINVSTPPYTNPTITENSVLGADKNGRGDPPRVSAIHIAAYATAILEINVIKDNNIVRKATFLI